MFDNELFIKELSVSPPLCDITLKDYSNRDVKSKLWIEVNRLMFGNWKKMNSEKTNK